jgi:hypothetical protein
MSKTADNPYPGARAFTQADQAFFFGRGPDTAAMVELWMGNRLTIASGPVASGKTSLLRAGVYPAMPVKRSRVLPVGHLGLQIQLALALAGDKALARERAREATDAADPPLSQAHKQLAMQLAGHRVGLSRPYPGAPERRRR